MATIPNDTDGSGTLGTEVEILRQRFFIDHTTKSSKYISEEYTLRCNVPKDESIDNIILTTHKFLPNLRIFDSDNSELPLVTNEYTRALFEQQLDETQDPTEKKFIEKLLFDIKHGLFVLWIKLPNKKRFYGQELRIITLEYDAKKEDFVKDRYHLDFVSASKHDVFYIIKNPEDYEFDIQKITLEEEGADVQVYTEDLENEGERVISRNRNLNSISIWVKPHVKGKMRIEYSFAPKKSIITFPKLLLVFLSYVPIQLMVFKYCGLWPECVLPSTADDLLAKQIEIGVGVVGASVVIAGLIHNHDIRDSLKFWYLLPILLTIVLLL